MTWRTVRPQVVALTRPHGALLRPAHHCRAAAHFSVPTGRTQSSHLSQVPSHHFNATLANIDHSSGFSAAESAILHGNGLSGSSNSSNPFFTPPPMSPITPLQRYYQLVESGTLRGDEHQTRIIQKLQNLHERLMTYDPPMIPVASESNSLARFTSFPHP
jgi:protein AFG1